MTEQNKNRIDELNASVKGKTAEEIIRFAFSVFGSRLSVASSLGEEDQVITDIVSKAAPGIGIFTLDTGRLFPETYELMAKTRKRYPMPFKVYYPDTRTVEDMVAKHGINLFYESLENRKLCCGVRKVEPLKRALEGKDAWISGLRRSQSVTRYGLRVFDWDAVNQKIKISPLADWSLDDVRAYVGKNNIDINPLQARGFLSIGCSCCTRAVKPGEDIRSGRWWWETPEQKECGLHVNLSRTVANQQRGERKNDNS